MAIKKAFKPVIEFLESNINSKVSTILDGVKDICSAKASGGKGGFTFIKDAKGVVTYVFCYYHKKWEAVTEVEYGVKTISPTGLNNMCKEGTSQWTKQHRASKKANEDLLTYVSTGEVAPEDIPKFQADIAAARDIIVPRADGHGMDEMPS